MTQVQDQKAPTSATPDLDDAELLGFEWLGPLEGTRAEQAIGMAFNKRGFSEGPTPESPHAN